MRAAGAGCAIRPLDGCAGVEGLTPPPPAFGALDALDELELDGRELLLELDPPLLRAPAEAPPPLKPPPPFAGELEFSRNMTVSTMATVQ